MRTDKSFSIDFIIRKDKQDKTEGYLFARVTVNGQNTEISLKEKIKVWDWDSRSETVKGKNKYAKSINDWIDEVRYKIKESRKALETNRHPITASTIKEHYEGRHTSQKAPTSGHTIKELIRFHNKIEGEAQHNEEAAKLKPGTMKNYGATEKYLTNFMLHKYKKEDVDLLDFDYQAVLELEYYIRNFPIKQSDPCLGNGVYKHMERVMKLFGMARSMRWLTDNPFELYELKKKRTVKERLTIQQFVAIENGVFNDDKLNYVRDLFIYDCYVGVSYVDLLNLEEGHFVEMEDTLFCTIYRQKSIERAGIPVPPAAIAIMNKYANTPAAVAGGKIFPYISNQDFNRNLKIIAGILNIPINLCTRKARDFFAKELNLKNGVPMETVSKMLGHSKISTTKENYADVDEEKIIDDTAHVQERFNLKKKKILQAV
ncbi:site-specific recombinase XerD [Filimonas zeae]|nr:site-specific integrase [Filimonas zeae]MDR6339883.1 site-specific recombinase XerD [Filimonas zeae]